VRDLPQIILDERKKKVRVGGQESGKKALPMKVRDTTGGLEEVDGLPCY